MAEVFQEIEAGDALVTNLLRVESLANMRKGDLIVVNNAVQSVALRSGTSGQILVTDSGTSTNLRWADKGPALGFTSSGQILTSGPNGDLVVLNQGTAGYVLTVNSSKIPVWQPQGMVTLPASGVINFSLEPGQIVSRSAGRTFTFFSWDDSEYGISGGVGDSNMALTAGNLMFWADGAGAKINSNRLLGTGTRLFTEYTTSGAGLQQVPVTIYPTADALFAFTASGTTGVNMYAFQMQFKSRAVPVA